MVQGKLTYPYQPARQASNQATTRGPVIGEGPLIARLNRAAAQMRPDDARIGQRTRGQVQTMRDLVGHRPCEQQGRRLRLVILCSSERLPDDFSQ